MRILMAAWLLTFASAHVEAISLASFDEERLASYTETPPPGTITVTWLGTTTLLFDDGVSQVLVDAFLSRPSLGQVTFGRLQTLSGLVDKILCDAHADRLRGIFVTHSHYDHALDVAHVALKSGALLYGTHSTLNLARGGGVKDEQLRHFVRWRSEPVGAFDVMPIPSKHSPPLPFVNDNIGERIREPIRQPLRQSAYVEGGTYDLLITHGSHRILVVASGNYEEGTLHDVRADVVFLAIGGIGTRSVDYHTRFYDNTVGCVRPRLVIPVHWDDFFEPLSGELPAMLGANTTFRYIRQRLQADGIGLGVMQGLQRVKLFDDDSLQMPLREPSQACDDYD
ncbi:MBL fold metallo-hydrolase [Burkholderia sp. THE68]|uniref:MBL fold metallo-hydrolase n=1 Tax=Burkholderia sp. THE68 TaxID=758782 RepID=UPI00138A4093|nr:MBL fold metallo-hydrolase [Burkholderia sp. THE68]